MAYSSNRRNQYPERRNLDRRPPDRRRPDAQSFDTRRPDRQSSDGRRPDRQSLDMRRPDRQCPAAGTTVITDPRYCCTPPESVAEELYSGISEEIVVLPCCDSVNGCGEYNAGRRCTYWPSFAHPRWLSCQELYDRRTRR